MNTPAFDRVRQGRMTLLLDEPFFGSLLMNLKLIEDPTCKTFCTDGRTLRFNPEYLDTLDTDELKTILAHEVMHCALLHPYRRDQRDLHRFNIAADYAINNFLDGYNRHVAKDGSAAPFPFTGPLANLYLDHAFDGKCAEEIYNLMPTPPPPQQPGKGPPQPGKGPPQPGQGPPQPGKGPPSDPLAGSKPGEDRSDDAPSSPGEFTDGAPDEAGKAEAEADWKVALQNAAMAGKSRGRLPAEIARLIGEILNPKVHWREHLRRFLNAVSKDDYSFSRPNRRYSCAGRGPCGEHCIMPGLYSPKLGKIVCAVDTSGSIDEDQFNEFMAEVNAIFFDCKPAAFVVAQCDAHLHEWLEVQPFDDLTLIEGKGGGGTSFVPVFDRALEEVEPPAALIYLTDLDGGFPDYIPPFPVLWAVTGKKSQAPFGEVLNVL